MGSSLRLPAMAGLKSNPCGPYSQICSGYTLMHGLMPHGWNKEKASRENQKPNNEVPINVSSWRTKELIPTRYDTPSKLSAGPYWLQNQETPPGSQWCHSEFRRPPLHIAFLLSCFCEVELRSVEVQHPDSWLRTNNKKHGMCRECL